jgi:hypothetical protein
MKCPFALHTRLGQQLCDAGDPSAIDRRYDFCDVLIDCCPRPYGSIQASRPTECQPHEVLQAVGLDCPGIKVLNV